MDAYGTDTLGPINPRFHARPVIGGVFIKMLADRAIWTKWAAMDKTKPGTWAVLPPAPKVTDVIPSSQNEPKNWRYTTEKPPEGWTAASFNDQQWKEGPAGFGNQGSHHTDWKTDDIWIRRTWTIPQGVFHHLQLNVFHDEDVEVYINGVLAMTDPSYVTSYDIFEIKPEALALLKPGTTVTVSAHCHQTQGGQGVDLGLVDVSN